MNDVSLDGAERLVFDDNEDLLLLLQVDEITKPGLLGKSGKKDKKKNKACYGVQQYRSVESVNTNPSIYGSAGTALGGVKAARRGYPKGKEHCVCVCMCLREDDMWDSM